MVADDLERPGDSLIKLGASGTTPSRRPSLKNAPIPPPWQPQITQHRAPHGLKPQCGMRNPG